MVFIFFVRDMNLSEIPNIKIHNHYNLILRIAFIFIAYKGGVYWSNFYRLIWRNYLLMFYGAIVLAILYNVFPGHTVDDKGIIAPLVEPTEIELATNTVRVFLILIIPACVGVFRGDRKKQS